MSIGRQGKNVFLSFLVSLLLVFSLNIVADAAYFEDYEDQVRWDLAWISELINNVHISLETYLPDIQDYLYYNGKSAAYYLSEIQNYVNASVSHLLLSNSYLSKIESHLATIANNSGSSGSSSGTDLTGVLEWLETATGLIGHTQLGVDAANAHLNVISNYLYQVSTKLDGVSSMVTSLNTATTYLYWISSDVEDVLEELKTATELIGSTSLDVDALVTGMGVTQDLIAAVNTNLTTMINNQKSVNDSLSGIEDALIYNGSSIARFATVLPALNDNLLIAHGKMNTMIGNQEAILALLQQDGAFTTDISGVLANQQELSTTLSNIDNALSAQGVNAATYLSLIDDHLSSIRAYVVSMDTRQLLIQETLTRYSDYLGYKGFTLANYAYQINENLVNKMATVTSNQEAVLAMLQADGAFTTDISGILANQQVANITLSSIEDALIYNGSSIARFATVLPAVNDNLLIAHGKMNTMIGNQEAVLAMLQADGAFTTDLSGIEEKLQQLIDLIEDLELTTNVTIENIENITIDVTNKAYEVFYITDSEGNEQNLADFSGDVLTISGRLLNFFFKVAFDDALDSVDSALDDMTEFYIDDSVLVGGGSLWE